MLTIGKNNLFWIFNLKCQNIYTICQKFISISLILTIESNLIYSFLYLRIQIQTYIVLKVTAASPSFLQPRIACIPSPLVQHQNSLPAYLYDKEIRSRRSLPTGHFLAFMRRPAARYIHFKSVISTAARASPVSSACTGKAQRHIEAHLYLYGYMRTCEEIHKKINNKDKSKFFSFMHTHHLHLIFQALCVLETLLQKMSNQ